MRQGLCEKVGALPLGTLDMHSDQGREFESELWQEMCHYLIVNSSSIEFFYGGKRSLEGGMSFPKLLESWQYCN